MLSSVDSILYHAINWRQYALVKAYKHLFDRNNHFDSILSIEGKVLSSVDSILDSIWTIKGCILTLFHWKYKMKKIISACNFLFLTYCFYLLIYLSSDSSTHLPWYCDNIHYQSVRRSNFTFLTKRKHSLTNIGVCNKPYSVSIINPFRMPALHLQ